MSYEHSLQIWVRPDKVRYPAPGLLCGCPGATGELLLDREPIPRKAFTLTPGHELVLRIPGGGGFGDPRERDPLKVAADLEAGYVTAEAAEEFYAWPR